MPSPRALLKPQVLLEPRWTHRRHHSESRADAAEL